VRLLFDEQLSEELSTLLDDIFPDSLHVRQRAAGGSPDTSVWELARAQQCVLVTKDEDFHRLSVLRGAPPKIVWIRIGNCATQDVAQLLREHHAGIRRFVEQEEASFLELGWAAPPPR
jgi:predicted nuclease of predicted toxin-antitoxin system